MKKIIFSIVFGVCLILIALVAPVYGNLTATEGFAIDLSSGGAGLDQTIAFDPTEMTGARSFNDGATDASFAWTFDLNAGTDPVITFGDGIINATAGAWQVSGNAVYYSGGTDVVHEDGGLEADVSAYGGIVGVNGGSTLDVDTLAELLTAMGDVTAFITDDDMPAAGTDPDVDATGEIGRDTDGANETGDLTLRGYDGSNQFCWAAKLKYINLTLIEPDEIDAADLIPVWLNTSGMTATFVEWHGFSDDDDVSLEFECLTDRTDFTAITTMDAVEIATDGTSVYYASDSTWTSATVAHDDLLAIDFDDSDTPDYVMLCAAYWLNSDVN